MMKVFLYKSEIQHDQQKQQTQLYILSYIYELLFIIFLLFIFIKICSS